MDITGFYNVSNRTITSGAASGESSLDIPPIVGGEAVRVQLRFTETIAGATREITPDIRSVRGTLGLLDVQPQSGSFALMVDDEHTTAPIVFDLDDAAEEFASAIQAALNASTLPSGSEATVTYRDGSHVVVFGDGDQHTIAIANNLLFPVSHVRVRTFHRGGVWEHELRLMRSPVALTSTFGNGASPAPEVTGLRDGDTFEDTVINELQRLYIPPTFEGTYQLVRDATLRTDPLSRKSTLAQLTAALSAIAGAGGEFITSVPIDNVAYIEFSGDLGGIDQPLLDVVVFDPPPPTTIVTLNTASRGMADELQFADDVGMILELMFEIADPDIPGAYNWHAVIRQAVLVRKPLSWDDLAAAPNIDFLNPPTFVQYNAFAPGQVSNGQLHYAREVGNGSATSFIVDHGLNTLRVGLQLLANAVPGASYVEGADYTWTRVSANRVSITWLGILPPATNSVQVIVLGLELTSFFDPHGHVIDDIELLRDWMDSTEARLSRLESLSGTGTTLGTSADQAQEKARWTLPTIFEVFPGANPVPRPGGGNLHEIDTAAVDATGAPVVGRGKGLLPAIHDASLDNVTSVPGTVSGNAGKVYRNSGSLDLLAAGGKGNRSQPVKPGELFGCDGRMFYPVVQYGQFTGTPFVNGGSPDIFVYAFPATDEPVPTGTVVRLNSTGALPTGLANGPDYVLSNLDHVAGTFQLLSADTGEPVARSGAGSGTHTLMIEAETSYYPRHFERTLFTIHINDKQFKPRTDFNLFLSLEAALLRTNTSAQWSVFFEIGEPRQLSTGLKKGVNLSDVVWRKLPILEQRIVLSPSSTVHRFGVILQRRVVGGVDRITGQRYLYGSLEGGVVPPASANFSIRARLGRFDTEDSVADPTGLVAVSGLSVGDTAQRNTVDSAYEFGYAIVQ